MPLFGALSKQEVRIINEKLNLCMLSAVAGANPIWRISKDAQQKVKA